MIDTVKVESPSEKMWESLFQGENGIWGLRRQGRAEFLCKAITVRAHAMFINALSVAFIQALNRVFRLQQEDVDRRLRSLMLGKGYVRKDEMQFDMFVEHGAWHGMVVTATHPVYVDVMTASGARAHRQMGEVSGSFVMYNQRARDWLRDKEMKFATQVNSTTIGQLRNTLQEGYAAGETYRELTARTAHVFAGTTRATGYRAMRIARTEVNSVSNYGLVEGFKEMGVGYKEWLSAFDARPAHLQASGQRVHIDQPFNVMGESLMHPGDPVGSPENIINCRCVVRPVV